MKGLFFNLHLRMLIDFRKREDKREGERKRNINVREKHQFIASPMCPDRGSNPQPFDVLDGNPTN